MSRDLVKRILVEVSGMKKFSLQWVPHELTIAQKRPRVADSQKLLQTLIADAPNEFINLTWALESWYRWFFDH
jgi:hypothetical protein